MRGQMMNGFQGAQQSASPFGVIINLVVCIFVMLLFLSITALVVIFIVKMLRSPRHMHPQMGFGVHQQAGSNAVSILNERYAKGEITGEEYLKIKEDLLKQ
jgi:uncharacterized membrane protein